MHPLLSKDLVFVTGKGGVGKTVVSAALALAAAEAGKRVLVAMCNAKERLSEHLQVPQIGSEIQRVAPRIDAVNMVPERALEEYGMMILKVRAVYRAIFENRLVASFLRGTPGIAAWSMLGKACFHARERTPDGAKRYDLVIVDGPATGHALEMLRVPRVILDVAPPGLLRQEAAHAWALLQDAQRASVTLVTLAEELPVTETLEMYEHLQQDLRLPVSHLVINQLLPALFEVGESERLSALRQARGESPSARDAIAQILCCAQERASHEQRQRQARRRLEEAMDVEIQPLPFVFSGELHRPVLEDFAQRF